MPKPTLLVEVAFNAGYSTPAASRTWTDVTSWVQHPTGGVRLDKWRSEEFSVCQPSHLSLTLKNTDGRFTPGNASGAHYPNVKKGRPIRVTVTHNGNTYRRFLGYIDDWVVTWPATMTSSAPALCTVTASSRMARMATSIKLKSIVEEETLDDDPVLYYRLNEPSVATTASDSSGNNAAPLLQAGAGTAAVTFGAEGLDLDDATAASFTTGGKYLRATYPAAVITGDLTIEAFVEASSGYAVVAALSTSASQADYLNESIVVAVSAVGNEPCEVTIRDTDGSAQDVLTGSTAVGDGQPHHLALSISGTAARLYVDGVEEATATLTGRTAGQYNTLYVGGSDNDGTTASAVAHVAVYDTALAADRIAAHADAGLTGFAGETAAARLTRYAGYAGIPSAECSFETGDVPGLAHIDTTGKKALDVMRTVEATEAGVLFDAGDGTLTFHDRSHRYGAASAFTAALSTVVTPIAPLLNDRYLVNDMTATGSTGVTARVFDQTSVDDYGPYDDDLDLATSDPDEPLLAAGWRVGRYAEPGVRVPDLEIHLNKASVALTDQVLAAVVGTKLTVSGLPSTAPASSMVLFVEGMEEVIDAKEHRVVLKTSPAEVFDVWILDDSTYSVLGTTTRLAY